MGLVANHNKGRNVISTYLKSTNKIFQTGLNLGTRIVFLSR